MIGRAFTETESVAPAGAAPFRDEMMFIALAELLKLRGRLEVALDILGGGADVASRSPAQPLLQGSEKAGRA